MSGHRFANLIDARGWPYRTFAIVGRGDETLTVQPVTPDGQPVPNSSPRPISNKAPLRLYVDVHSAYAARGMHRYHTE